MSADRELREFGGLGPSLVAAVRQIDDHAELVRQLDKLAPKHRQTGVSELTAPVAENCGAGVCRTEVPKAEPMHDLEPPHVVPEHFGTLRAEDDRNFAGALRGR